MLPRLDFGHHTLDVPPDRMVTHRLGHQIMDIRDYPLGVCVLIMLPTLIFWLTFWLVGAIL